MSRWVGNLFLIESSVVQTQFQELYQDVVVSNADQVQFHVEGAS